VLPPLTGQAAQPLSARALEPIFKQAMNLANAEYTGLRPTDGKSWANGSTPAALQNADQEMGTRSQGEWNVSIHNYGSNKVETRQTPNGRGGRDLEVIVGEMAARQISKAGTAPNKAVRQTTRSPLRTR
jgi:hypothetical protein